MSKANVGSPDQLRGVSSLIWLLDEEILDLRNQRPPHTKVPVSLSITHIFGLTPMLLGGGSCVRVITTEHCAR